MIPAKNRDRKCSTCRHYQASPLWRKGWCRNPLLYDRNTNHLVESDSLACNRTFIDYWEPVVGPVAGVSTSQARSGSNNPRIAPSIPMDTTDAQGNRGVTTGNTPAAGMAAFAEASAVPLGKKTREIPKLALVTPDYDPDDLAHADNELESATVIKQPAGLEGTAKPLTTSERIRQARRQSSFFETTMGRISIVVLALVLLTALVGGGFLFTRGNEPEKMNSVLPLAGTTVPVPTPTGFGDATAAPATSAAQIAPSGVIGVSGWVRVQADGNLTMRDAPSKDGAKLASLPDGTTARVVDGPTEADGFTWWKVEAADKGQGWCAGQFLSPIPPPAP